MQIQSGTASVINGSNNVIAGAGVDWSAATANCLFVVPGGVLYTIAATVAPGVSMSGFWELNLSVPYEGTTNAATVYAIAKDFMPTWGFAIIDPGDIETAQLINRNFAIVENGMGGPAPGATVGVVALNGYAALTALVTPSQFLRTVHKVFNSADGTTKEWMLIDSTHADAPSDGWRRPDDYDDPTNTRVYVLID